MDASRRTNVIQLTAPVDLAGSNSESEWPSPACLNPVEIEDYVARGFLAQDRLQHLESCDFCQLVTDFDPRRRLRVITWKYSNSSP